jgi:hypothetical protein
MEIREHLDKTEISKDEKCSFSGHDACQQWTTSRIVPSTKE